MRVVKIYLLHLTESCIWYCRFYRVFDVIVVAKKTHQIGWKENASGTFARAKRHVLTGARFELIHRPTRTVYTYSVSCIIIPV